MKHVWACLSAKEDRESRFHYYGSPVRLVEACLCGGKSWSRRFIQREGAVKQVEACLCAREDRESRFHRCEGPMRLGQACLYAGTT